MAEGLIEEAGSALLNPDPGHLVTETELLNPKAFKALNAGSIFEFRFAVPCSQVRGSGLIRVLGHMAMMGWALLSDAREA